MKMCNEFLLFSTLIYFACVNGTYVQFYRDAFAYIPRCDGKADLYLLAEQTVQVTRISHSLTVAVCVNATRAPTAAFDPETLLRNVTELQLWDINMWPPLPENSQIVQINMADVKPVSVFGGCNNLTTLRLASSKEFETPVDWLAGCAQLRELTLAHFSAAQARAVIDTVPQLRAVIFDALHDWPTIIQDPIFPTPRGREQTITKINMVEYYYRYKYNDENFARSLNTTWNEVSAAMVEQLSSLSRLEDLSIREIMNFNFCPFGNVSSVMFRSLRRLMVSATKTDRVCFGRLRAAPQMTHLEIGNPLFARGSSMEIQFRELFSTRAPSFVVDVWGGSTEFLKVEGFFFEEEDYHMLIDGERRANMTLPILRLSIECECQNAWLARALRERLLTAPGITCRDGRPPVDRPPERLECDRVNCTEDCYCRRDWHANALIADCSDAGLTALPTELLAWTNLSELLVPGNSILTIPKQLPNNLAEMAALFAVKTRRVRLSGNPIVCACDNRIMLQALQMNRGQVEDYDKILCVGDKTKLEKANLTVLCAQRDLETALAAKREAILVTTVSVTVTLAAIGLVAAIAYYFRRTIRIYLFARGWCLSCLREDDLDADRRFDVFLSYCHEDYELVHEKILSVLDKEYSVCEHNRDWCPGSMIPTQIMWSVELSKRTLVILSRNFVKSLWGVLEFRMAYASSLSEGRVRVVMVILDDVLESNELHGELRAYVQLNTYVKWEDPWFWDKMKYALPHRMERSAPKHPFNEATLNVDRVPPIEMAVVPYNSSTNLREPREVVVTS